MNHCFKSVFNRSLGVWQTTSELTSVAGKSSAKAVCVVVFAALASGHSMATSVDLTSPGGTFDMSAAGNQTIETLSGVASTTVNLGSNTLTFGDATNRVLYSAIIGTGSLIKNGAGIQTLGGVNSFSGGITLNAGGLILSNNGALGSGALTVAGVGSLDSTSALNISNAITLDAGSVLSLYGSQALTLAGNISGAGTLVKNGASYLTLSGTNNFSGGMNLNAGGLLLSNSSALGTGALNVGGSATLDGSSALNLSNNINLNGALNLTGGQAITLNGVVSGASSLIKNGASTLTLNAANWFSGGVTLNAGTLVLGNSSALGTGALNIGGMVGLDSSTAVNIANNVYFGANNVLILQGSEDITFNGVVSGTGTLLKNGPSVLTLNGSNTFHGGIALNGGGLVLGNNAALGANELHVGANATLDTNTSINLTNNNIALGANLNFLGSQSLTVGGVIWNTGGVSKSGAATLTLTGANTYSGGTTINAGTLALGAGGSLASFGNVNLAGAGATFDISGSQSNQTVGALSGVSGSSISLGGYSLTFGNSSNQTFNGSISGSGSLVKTGAGVQTLGGASTFSGGVTVVNGGGLVVGNDAALGTGTLTILDAATLDANGPVTLANKVVLDADLTVLGSNALTLNGNISGAGGLTKNGAATLTLNGTNTYTGGTIINSGTLALGAGASLASTGIVDVAAGATFDLSAGNGTQSFGILTGSGTINLGGNTLTIGDAISGVFAGAIGGTGGLIKEGGGAWTLTGNNTYSGSTMINAGTLAIGAGGSIANTSVVNLVGAATGFDISAGGNQTIGGLAGGLSSTVALGANTLTLNGTGNYAYSGAIHGTGSLVKNGLGIQTLNGANTFSGGVTLNAGGLVLGNNGALGSGTLTVGGNASLDTGIAVALSNNIVLAAGSNLDLLGSNALTLGGVISGAGGISKNGAATVTLTSANTYSGNTIINAGTLAVGAGGTLGLNSALNFSGTGTLDISAGGNQAVASLAGVAGSAIALGNSALTVAGSTDTTFSGSISGNGGLIKHGSGTLALNGASTFGGGVTLVAGGLSVGNNTALGSGTLSLTGAASLQASSQVALANNVALGANLTVSGDHKLDLDGVISGGNGLVKNGTGTLTLNGSNTYTGTTLINQGTLRVTNTNQSGMIVNSGATLAGSGAIGTTAVNDGATLHAELGTLTINGSYQQASNGLLRIDANSATQYGKLDVTGIASFTPNARIDVNVLGSNTLANNNVLTNVIKAGAVNATDFVVTDNSALFNFETILRSDGVDLRVLSTSTTGIQDAVKEMGLSPAAGAAKVLDGMLNSGASGDMGAVINAFGQLPNNRDVARATGQTLPVVSGNQAVTGALATIQRLVQNRTSGGGSGISSGDALQDKQAWGRVFGSRAEQDNRGGNAGFTADSWGMAFGADAEVQAGTRFGVAYGYAKTSVNGNADLTGTSQRANIDSHVISAYGSKDIGGNRSVSFQADVGVNNNKSTRPINFGGLIRNASADYRTYSAHLGTAIEQRIELGANTTLTPALRADYTWLKSQSYQEAGAGSLNLDVASNRTDAFVIGADTYFQHRFTPTSRIDAYVGVGYDTINERGNIIAAYAGAPGQSFLTTGIDHSPWLVRGGVGYGMTTTNGTKITLRYDAEGRSDYINHTASVRANWAF